MEQQPKPIPPKRIASSSSYGQRPPTLGETGRGMTTSGTYIAKLAELEEAKPIKIDFEVIRMQAKYLFSVSPLGIFYQRILLLSSIASGILYIVQTYLSISSPVQYSRFVLFS